MLSEAALPSSNPKNTEFINKFNFDDKQLENGRMLFSQPCDFILSATKINQVPETEIAEVAFAGRSNVGKSTLINALTGRKTLARTSNTPGRTRQINFFDLAGKLMLVDLPGYGYARAPKKEIAEWTALIENYLRGRRQLYRVCLLIDARHGPKETDHQAMALLDQSAVPYQLILTKCDKLKIGNLQLRLGDLNDELSQHAAAHPHVIATSSRNKNGISELQAEIALLAVTN